MKRDDYNQKYGEEELIRQFELGRQEREKEILEIIDLIIKNSKKDQRELTNVNDILYQQTIEANKHIINQLKELKKQIKEQQK